MSKIDTKVLRSLINQSKDKEEETKVADLSNRKKNKDKKDEALTQAETPVTTTEGVEAEEQTVEGTVATTPVEGEKSEEEKAKEAGARLAEMLEDDDDETPEGEVTTENKDQGANGGSANPDGTTNEFANQNTGKRGQKKNKDYKKKDESEWTDEERAQAVKDAEDHRKKVEAARAHNENVTSRTAQLKKEADEAVGELTLEQQTLIARCKKYYRAEALFVEEGPCPNIGITRTWVKKDGVEARRPATTDKDVEALKQEGNKKLKKANYFIFEAKLKYGYSLPKKVFGGAISMPRQLNVPITAFKSGEFTLPSGEDFKPEERCVHLMSFDTMYAIISIFCGKEIMEADYISKSDMTAHGSKLVTGLQLTKQKQKNGSITDYNKRVFKAAGGRKKLLTKSNIVPMKVYNTTAMASMDSSTKLAILENFGKALSFKSGEEYSNFDAMEEKLASVVQGTMDDGKVKGLQLGFLNGQATLGQGKLKDYALLHWSDVTTQGGVSKARVVTDNRVPIYTAQRSQKTNELTYKKSVAVFGENIKLQDLANGGPHFEAFPAAKRLIELKVTDEQIVELYNDYKRRLQEAKQAQIVSSNAETTTRINNELSADVMTKQLLMHITGGENKGDGPALFDINFDEVRAEMINMGEN